LSIDNFTNIKQLIYLSELLLFGKEGVPFSPAQTAATLDLNMLIPLVSSGIHNYSVSYIEPGCTEVTNEIKVEIYPGVMTTVPPSICVTLVH
jgi:hypothetical protein